MRRSPSGGRRILFVMADSRETQTIDLTGCARCDSAGHKAVSFERFDQPMVGPDGTTWDWWAACPTNGQPILMRTSGPAPVFACRR